MSHGIMENDHAFYGGREPAWHRLGTVIEQDTVVSNEAMRLARLDWNVELHPLISPVGRTTDNGEWDVVDIDIPDRFATIRMDTMQPLGVVGTKYTIVQNNEAFDFFDEIIGRGDAHYHTAGSLYNGRKVWALARLNRDILIGGDKDERIDPFICLVNGHDGNTPVSVYTTPIRVVCQNTLQWSLGGTKNKWKGKHTASITQKARDARDVLGISNEYFDSLQTMGDALINQHINAADFHKMVERLVPLPEIKEGDSPRGLTIAQNKREGIADAWMVDNLNNVRYTKWGFVQAVAEYVDWHAPHRNDDRFVDKNLLGANQTKTLKDRSVEVALNY